MRKISLKISAIILSACMLLGVSSCGKNSQTSTEPIASVSTSVDTPASVEPSPAPIVDASVDEKVDSNLDLAETLKAEFLILAAEGKTPLEIATALGAESFCGYDCAISEYQEGFLNGFNSDVTGFSGCAGFAPWIGSIPFVGYVFELENEEVAKTFASDIATIADPMWNICTEAKDPVIESYGNLVFLTMVPNEDF